MHYQWYATPRRRPTTKSADGLKFWGFLLAAIAVIALTVLCGLLAAVSASGAEPAAPSAIDGPDRAEPGDLVVLSATVPAKTYVWAQLPDTKKWKAFDGGKCVVFATSQPGAYTFIMATAAGDVPSLFRHDVTIGKPTPPVPPIPPVPPDPPTPPIPSAGLNVAVILPTPGEVRSLTPAQVAILTSRTVRDYLEAQCEKDDDGKTPAYRGLLRSADPGLLSPRWRTLLQKVDTSQAWLVAAKGSRAYSAKLPANVDETMKILVEVAGAPAQPAAPLEFPKLRVIPDGDWAKYNPPPGADGQKVADVGGEPRYLALKPRDLKSRPYGSLAYARPLGEFGINVIPRAEWPGRIAALKAANAGLMPLTYKIPPFDQNGTNYCWCNCVAQGFGAMAAQQGRPGYRISAASVGGPITGYRNVGGWPGDAVEYMMQKGGVREDLWPSNAIASKYSSQTAVQADYARNKIVANIADLGASGKMFDEVATCVLLGAPVAVSYNWWSHAVLAVGLEQRDGTSYLILRNSWGDYEDNGFFLLPEGSGRNRGTPDDAQAILSVLQAAAHRSDQALAA